MRVRVMTEMLRAVVVGQGVAEDVQVARRDS
jgi:hypothetical protein